MPPPQHPSTVYLQAVGLRRVRTVTSADCELCTQWRVQTVDCELCTQWRVQTVDCEQQYLFKFEGGLHFDLLFLFDQLWCFGPSVVKYGRANTPPASSNRQCNGEKVNKKKRGKHTHAL